MAHYINYAAAADAEQRSRRRTRITFIDTNADKEMDFFKGRYENLFSLACHRYIDANSCSESFLRFNSRYGWVDPMESSSEWKHLSNDGKNFIDIEIEFIKGSLESEGIRKYLNHISDDKQDGVKDSKLTVAICLTMTHQAIAASLYMPVKVYEKAQEIWVYQRESADIINNLNLNEEDDESGNNPNIYMRYSKLRPFGMLYSEYLPDRKQCLKAMICNATYNQDCLDILSMKSADDKDFMNSYKGWWSGLSLDKAFSNKYFVDSIKLKLRSVGCQCDRDFINYSERLENDALAKSEHNRWNIQQLLFGYLPCGCSDDAEFQRLNIPYRDAEGMLNTWVDSWRNGNAPDWKYMDEVQRENINKLMNADSDYKNLVNSRNKVKDPFDTLKKDKKNGPRREHPNICDYDHLDLVDFGAKSYDKTLNLAIPKMLALIDFPSSIANKDKTLS